MTIIHQTKRKEGRKGTGTGPGIDEWRDVGRKGGKEGGGEREREREEVHENSVNKRKRRWERKPRVGGRKREERGKNKSKQFSGQSLQCREWMNILSINTDE